MGRKPTITRDGLLNVAEDLVREHGGSALTIGALAKAAGISKGGVQYSFSNRDDLIRSLINRWTSQFDAMFDKVTTNDPIEFIKSYIEITRTSQQATAAKVAGLMVSYLDNPDNLKELHDWYQGVFNRFTEKSPNAQTARVIFLAIEGLFLLHINGIDKEGKWSVFLNDIEAVLNRLID